LAPTGKAAVDKFRVTSQKFVGTDAESFANAGAKRLTKHIGLLNESLEKFDAFGGIEINRD
jgi:hypothetical protein